MHRDLRSIQKAAHRKTFSWQHSIEFLTKSLDVKNFKDALMCLLAIYPATKQNKKDEQVCIKRQNKIYALRPNFFPLFVFCSVLLLPMKQWNEIICMFVTFLF